MFTYFHSTWSESADAEHYIEIALPQPMTEFTLSYISRNGAPYPLPSPLPKAQPTTMATTTMRCSRPTA